MSDLTDRIIGAIWAELERQQLEERFGPFVNPNIDLIDGVVDMAAVAAAVVKESHLFKVQALTLKSET
jgi:hypothetical protein